MKYGIKVPRTVQEVKAFDLAAGNTMWQNAIDLKMNTIMPAFDSLEGDKPPPGYTQTSGHVVFDV